MVLLVLFGGSMVVRGSMTIGTFTAFMSYVILFFGPITQFAYIWSYYKSTSPAFDRINEIFNMERDEGGEEELIMKEGIVTFDDVWFSYNNKPILQGFNATFERGLNYVIGVTGRENLQSLNCSVLSTL
jgi:ATP-binding cassette subfamily B protein/subfamily B ATP-binding cassette protein MsbA